MPLFRRGDGRTPIRVEYIVEPPALGRCADAARVSLAVTAIDQALQFPDRAIEDVLLDVRLILAPSSVPVVPGRSR